MVAAELTLGFCYERSLSFKQPELRLRLGFVLRAAAATLGAGAVAVAINVSPFVSALVGSAIYIVALLALGIVPGDPGWALQAALDMNVHASGSEPESHAQFAEDRVLAEIFGERTDGICVEVGANDGRTGSASYLFEKRGWQCLLVEPIPALVEEIRMHRACTVVNCAASDRDGTATFSRRRERGGDLGPRSHARTRGVDPAGGWHDQRDNGAHRDTRQPARGGCASPNSTL